jgi:hypothetical protein
MKRGIINTILPYIIAGYTALATAGLLLEEPQKNQPKTEQSNPLNNQSEQGFGNLTNQEANQIETVFQIATDILKQEQQQPIPDTFTPDPMQGFQGPWGAHDAINYLNITEPNTLEAICTIESRCDPNQDTNKFQAHGMMQLKDTGALEALRTIFSPKSYNQNQTDIIENNPELITEKAQFLDPKGYFTQISDLYEIVQTRNNIANLNYNKLESEIKTGKKQGTWIPQKNHAEYKQLQTKKREAQTEIKDTRNLMLTMQRAFHGSSKQEQENYQTNLRAIQDLNDYLVTITGENIDHITFINKERKTIEAILEKNKTDVRTNVVLADVYFQYCLALNEDNPHQAFAAYNAGPGRKTHPHAQKYASNVQTAINKIEQ